MSVAKDPCLCLPALINALRLMLDFALPAEIDRSPSGECKTSESHLLSCLTRAMNMGMHVPTQDEPFPAPLLKMMLRVADHQLLGPFRLA